MRAGAAFTIIAIVTAEGFPNLSQRIKQWHQQLPARCEKILDVRRAAAVAAAFNQPVAFHVAQAVEQRAAANWVEGLEKFCRAARPACQIADDKQRPLVANYLQHTCYRASIAFTSPHCVSGSFLLNA